MHSCRAGEYEAAAAAYECGIRRTPQDPLLHANRSLALLRLGRAEAALEAAHCAARCDPTKAKFWGRMGNAHRALGQGACAQLCYEQAAALAPSDAEIRQR